MNRLVIIGASGHGKVCADIAQKVGYKRILFLDDNKKLAFCAGHPKYLDVSTGFFIAIGNPDIRQRVTEEIEKEQGQIITLIHPNAVIGDDVEIGNGSVIMAGAVLNTGMVID